MAFRQPTRQSVQRVIRSVDNTREDSRQQDASRNQNAGPDESQTWVLFSPATDVTTSTSYLSDVEDSAPTPGRSQIIELGSLSPIGRSTQDADSRYSGLLSSAIEDEEDEEQDDHGLLEDDAELDSLDSHLPDFRTSSGAHQQGTAAAPAGQHAAPVFPSHDGLGSFRLDRAAGGTEIQDHLYSFERYNSRKIRKRRESLDPAELELQQHEEQQAHKMQRIEAWRLEHSRILLQEIHKETRRRRHSSHASNKPRGSAAGQGSSLGGDVTDATLTGEHDSMDWHEESSADNEEAQGVFTKITRKVIRDIMGIDGRLLSVLLGEDLPEIEEELSSTPRATPAAGFPLATDTSPVPEDSSWQLRVLEHVARELGHLVHQLSPHPHPGAFSTYQRVQQTPLPYAGLPAIPEAGMSDSSTTTPPGNEASTADLPDFKPTMPKPATPSVDIDDRAGPSQAEMAASRIMTANREEYHSRATVNPSFTQEEWEQDLDTNLVFRYLRGRFTSRSPSAPTFTSGTSHLATCSTQDSAAKAARVRQHHPLVARSRPGGDRERRGLFKATAAAPSSPVASAAIAKRHTSSCASQSTRRSARRSSVSSRHYWDIGGSMGTGSMIAASPGPMGSWGEV